MSTRRASLTVTNAITVVTSLTVGALALGCVGAPGKVVTAPVLAVSAPTTIAAATSERVPALQRAELRPGSWSSVDHMDLKQVFMFDGKPTVVLAYVGDAAAAGPTRLIDRHGEASVARELSEEARADADQLGEVVTIFDAAGVCRAEIVGLQVGAFARFDDKAAHSAREIWTAATEYGSTYVLGELGGAACLDGITDAEAVLGDAASVPVRIADASQRAAVLPAFAALPAFATAQATYDEHQREMGEPSEPWVREDAITVQQVIVGRQRFVVASASVGGECGDWGDSLSAVWELSGAPQAPRLTWIPTEISLGELTRVVVSPDGLRVRNVHASPTAVHYGSEYDGEGCGC